jgi:hypothetical protein
MSSLYDAIHGINGWRGLANSRKEKQETYMFQTSFAGNFIDESRLKLSAIAPQVTVQRNRIQTTNQANAGDEEKFKDPYGKKFKERLLDAWVNDGWIQEPIAIRRWVGFGRPKETAVYPKSNKIYKTTDELEQAINDTFDGPKEFQKFTEYVQKVDAVTNIHEIEGEMFEQAVVGARSAAFMEKFTTENNPYKFPKGTPATIKPFNWLQLDQVRINPATWRITDIKYNDFNDEKSAGDDTKNFVSADRLLYFVRPSGHMIPNALYYGTSDLHSILKCSEIIRQILERDAPEIVTSMWSSSGIFEFDSLNKREQTDFMSQIKPALFRGWNKKVKYTPVQLKHDGWFLMNILDIMVKHILAKLRVPRGIIDFAIDNRAVGEAQLTAWEQAVVIRDREWSMSHLRDQWYKSLADIWYGEKTDKFYIKVIRTFMELEFEDVIAKANAIELLIRRNIILPFEARMMFPNLRELDSKELARLEKAELDKKKKELEMQQEAMAANMAARGGPGGPGQPNPFDKKKQEFGKKTPKDRTNSKIVSGVGAGRGNKAG